MLMRELHANTSLLLGVHANTNTGNQWTGGRDQTERDQGGSHENQTGTGHRGNRAPRAQGEPSGPHREGPGPQTDRPGDQSGATGAKRTAQNSGQRTTTAHNKQSKQSKHKTPRTHPTNGQPNRPRTQHEAERSIGNTLGSRRDHSLHLRQNYSLFCVYGHAVW